MSIPGGAASPLPRTSRWEGLRFTAEVALPNAAQGLFRRRRRLVKLVSALGVENRGRRLLTRLRSRYGEGPLWIRSPRSAALLVFGPEPIRFALSGSPDPFASDPDPKRSGMLKFQPTALTISRDRLWTERRAFTEFVIDEAHRDAALRGRFTDIAGEEARTLHGDVDFDVLNHALRRMTRRIVLGDAAATDDDVSRDLSTLMDKANPPGRGDEALRQRFVATLSRYAQAADPASLVGLFANAPVAADTDPVGQITHWMFAMSDSLAINVWRCLALLASHPEQLLRVRAEPGSAYLTACLQEAMRLWPTTAIVSRITTRAVEWSGELVAADTQVYIVNTFNHRDTARFEFADRFEPQVWLNTSAQQDWSFNHFGNGPQVCPGADLATRLGTAVLAALLERADPVLGGVTLDPGEPLPYTLDFYAVRIRLQPLPTRTN